MLETLNEFKLDDQVLDKIEGGAGTPADAGELQMTALGNIFHFGKNVAGGNIVSTGGVKSR